MFLTVPLALERRPPPSRLVVNLDGDGAPDRLVLGAGGSLAGVRLGGGSSRLVGLAPDDGYPHTFLAATDVDADGSDELFVTSGGVTVGLGVILQLGDGSLVRVPGPDDEGVPFEFAYSAHSNCCPYAAVGFSCAPPAAGGVRDLVQTEADRVQMVGYQPAAEAPIRWDRLVYRLHAGRIRLVSHQTGVARSPSAYESARLASSNDFDCR